MSDVNTKKDISIEIRDILNELEKQHPNVTEGLAAAVGASVGATGSFILLGTLGVSGYSAVGLTTGLAAAGMGGGMLAGMAVLAAPIAILGIAGYAIAKSKRNAQLTTNLGKAIAKLYNIQERLLKNAEYFKEEIAQLTMIIDMLQKKKP